jgi:hypothetical protein
LVPACQPEVIEEQQDPLQSHLPAETQPLKNIDQDHAFFAPYLDLQK